MLVLYKVADAIKLGGNTVNIVPSEVYRVFNYKKEYIVMKLIKIAQMVFRWRS